jgi:hypothetical protein
MSAVWIADNTVHLGAITKFRKDERKIRSRQSEFLPEAPANCRFAGLSRAGPKVGWIHRKNGRIRPGGQSNNVFPDFNETIDFRT